MQRTYLAWVLLLVTQFLFAAEIEFTAEELLWMQAQPILKVAPDPNFQPYEFFSDTGIYQGIGADYLALVGQKTGLQFDIVQLDNWLTVLSEVEKKQVDLLPMLAESKQRSDFLLFSAPFYHATVVIISTHKYENIKELYGQEMAVVAGYVFIDILKQLHPAIRLVIVEDVATGLELVSLGAVESMIGSLPTLAREAQNAGVSNIHIVERLEKQVKYRIAVRDDWPVLMGIVQKALSAITPEEHQQIKAKWTGLGQDEFWLKPVFWYSTLAIVSLLFLVILGVSLWNSKLRKQVKIRSQQLHQAQMKLIHAEKMETIGRLAAGIAHEVKNPLAIIQMGVDYLSQSSEDPLDKQVIQDIDDAVLRADRVIRGLLDFSRDQQLDTAVQAVNPIINHALHLVTHEMQQRNIQVQTELSDSLPEIALDANKLQQVFINIFMNAAHAIERNGSISVSAKITVLEDLSRVNGSKLQPGDAVIVIEVCDDGKGLEEGADKKIFDPFFTTKPQGEGTGLGLSVSQNILALHQGSIDLKNREEGGVSVMLYFSCADSNSILNEGIL